MQALQQAYQQPDDETMLRVVEHEAEFPGGAVMSPEIDGRPAGERLQTEPVYGVGAKELDFEHSDEEAERAFDEARRRARKDLEEKVGKARWWKDERLPVDLLGPFRVFGAYGVMVVIRGVQAVEEENEDDYVERGEDG